MEDEELRVGDVMTKGVICVDVEETVQSAAEIMKRNDISSIIVLEKGSGVGIVTEHDIICNIVTESREPRKVKIKEIMTTPLLTIKPESSIDDAARAMRDNNVHRLVVTRHGKIIGIISESDVVRVEPTLHLLIREHSKWDIADINEIQSGVIYGICEGCDNYSENLRSIDGRMLCDECRSQ